MLSVARRRNLWAWLTLGIVLTPSLVQVIAAVDNPAANDDSHASLMADTDGGANPETSRDEEPSAEKPKADEPAEGGPTPVAPDDDDPPDPLPSEPTPVEPAPAGPTPAEGVGSSDDPPPASPPSEPADATDASTQSDKPAEPAAAEAPTAEPTPAKELPREPTLAEPVPDESAAPDAETAEAELTPAILKGVQPGKTTRDELHAAWGKPLEITRVEGGERETFAWPPYDKVQATVVKGIVDSLAMHLEKPVAINELELELEVDAFDPVEVLDVPGRVVGRAYPERGVLFGLAAKSDPPKVVQIVIQPIDAQPFLDRGWKRLETSFADCLADLRRAVELSPDAVEPRVLHVELTLRAGDLEQALGSARDIVKREPKKLEHRLLLARVLAAKGDHTQAIKLAGDVALSKSAAPLVLAKAHSQLGDALAASERHDYARAIKHHQKAIELAQPLAGKQEFAERRAAKEILLAAHLAVAHDIGWGRWQQKSKIVPQWLARSSALAESLVVAEHAPAAVRLRMCELALRALAGIEQPPDAKRWIEGIKTTGIALHDEAADPLVKAQLAWHIGVALGDAVEVEAARGQHDAAIELGELARGYFDQGASAGKQFPERDFLPGRLCYRVGAVLAIDKLDHQRAIGWFDRAVPLLERPVPAAVVERGKQGETFVSIAVSYWETGQRAESLRLTEQGVALMEQAVAEGTLDKSALAIPYANLASMHEAQGDAKEAKRFAELASRHEASAKK